jgi:hypothetical protein
MTAPFPSLRDLSSLGQNTNDRESSLEESSSDHSSGDEFSGGDAESNSVNIVPTLEWREGAGKPLKRPYGVGSESTRKRQRRRERELKQAASNTLDITDLFRR